MKELEPAASKLGLVLQSIPILQSGEIEGAFEAAKQASAQAIVTMDAAGAIENVGDVARKSSSLR